MSTGNTGQARLFNPNSKPKERRNWLIYTLYTRGEHDECLRVIEEALEETNNRLELACFVKGLILRSRGDIQGSLDQFRMVANLDPMSLDCLKQLGRSLFLTGKHKKAIETYERALSVSPEDWEVWHNKGLCHLNRGELEDSNESFRSANLIQKHDATFLQLGKSAILQDDFMAAVDVYLEALESSPESPELLTTIGLLYLRMNQQQHAFHYLGTSLTVDQKNMKTLLATGSIIQDRGDHDAALLKYRVISAQNPNSAPLWNNIGMCFFGKGKNVAAISCLKRAQYLDPFEYIIAYNLGIVHINTQQFASAFHYFSSAVTLNPKFAFSYMYLGLSLSKLGDDMNAISAFEKAEGLKNDYLILFNYALASYNMGYVERAKKKFAAFEAAFGNVDESTRNSERDILEKSRQLQQELAAF